MALSKLEKAMATYILGFTPAGRKALEIALVAAVRTGQAASPFVARGAATALPPVARAVANPYVGVPLGLAAATYGTQQYLEETGIQEDVNVARDKFMEALVPTTKKLQKRKRSVYNQAVSKAMKAVKASTKGGPRGTLSNAKRTFGQVSKAVSRVKKGGKIGAKGVTGVIKRSISGMFKPKPKRRTSSKTTYTFRSD
jgi:hypothetical protein